MSIEIIQAGAFTTVQDGGRSGWAHLGVPVSGFMDAPSAHEANRMVGNNCDEALLEITWTGVSFKAGADCTLALAGAEFVCYHNESRADLTHGIQLAQGDYFKMGRLLSGVRAYLSFAGGFNLPTVAGSQSTLPAAKIGGLAGRPLHAGDQLILNQHGHVPTQRKRPWLQLKSKSVHVIRAMPGPEYDWFSPAMTRQAFGQAYQLTQDSSRQGFRLQSEAIACDHKLQMSSSGLVPGSLQVTPDGQTILAMKDAQTTGGYPRLLVVNQEELHKLAQVRPGEEIFFFVSPTV